MPLRLEPVRPVEGWARVQAICDFAHRHIPLRLRRHAPTPPALQAWQGGRGRVPRLCAPVGHAVPLPGFVPARYVTGYLGDIGMPPPFMRRWISPPGWRSRRPVAHLRRAQQHASASARADGARARRRRRRSPWCSAGASLNRFEVITDDLAPGAGPDPPPPGSIHRSCGNKMSS